MCVPLMLNFKAEVSAVKDVSPSVYHMTFTFNNGLIEVESVEVECHGADAEGGKPDAHNRPRSQEKVETATVVKGSILKN